MVDEKAWAAIRVFVVGVVAILDLPGGLPTGVVLIVGLFAAVLLLGEIRDGMRGAR